MRPGCSLVVAKLPGVSLLLVFLCKCFVHPLPALCGQFCLLAHPPDVYNDEPGALRVSQAPSAMRIRLKHG